MSAKPRAATGGPDGVRPKKSLGQHFLRDPNTVRRIADAVGAPAGAPVVEIGPGTGALTGPLLERYPHLTAVEVDARAVEHLRGAYPGLDVRHQDVLEVDWAALAQAKGAELWVAGNLPYYITSPILFALLDARAHLRRAVVMMQREVAERIVARPGSKAYGILSVQLQLLARPAFLFPVSRHVFYPPPKIESAVLALDFDAAPLPVSDAVLKRVVRTAFNQRRKQLRNSLKAVGEVPEAWASRRPEALPPAAFVALAQAMGGAG